MFYRARKICEFSNYSYFCVPKYREKLLLKISLIPSAVHNTPGCVFVFQQYVDMKGKLHFIFTSVKLWPFQKSYNTSQIE